jgi:hypothetical protein
MAGEKYQYVETLAERVAADPALAEQVKNDPAGALKQLAAAGPVPDTWIYRIVVLSLGAAVLIALVAASILAGYGKPVPEGVIAIGSVAAGALAGLLAPSPVRA